LTKSSYVSFAAADLISSRPSIAASQHRLHTLLRAIVVPTRRDRICLESGRIAAQRHGRISDVEPARIGDSRRGTERPLVGYRADRDAVRSTLPDRQ
jgi:hypothetical protein